MKIKKFYKIIDWISSIVSVKWNVGDVNVSLDPDTMNSANRILAYEDDIVTTNTCKIRLMYASDYYYAADATGTTKCFRNSACLNWLTYSGSGTWTMTRWGKSYDYIAYFVAHTGEIQGTYFRSEYNLNPTFYLSQNVQYTGIGDGSNSNPLQISPAS